MMKVACLPMMALALFAGQAVADDDADRLVGAMLGDTPVITDLRSLTDEIGGRATGSPANQAAVEWALARFVAAGVTARKEAFDMPNQWQELSVQAVISGDLEWAPEVVAKPLSRGGEGLAGPLVDGGRGSVEDFERLGAAARGAWVLLETPVLDDEAGLTGLFAEFTEAASTTPRALDAGAAGIVHMSSRPHNLLYRFPDLVTSGRQPILVMAREDALRAQRLLRDGKSLTLTATVDLDSGYAYQADNVIGEIRGSERPQEIVLFGAHLDSHDLGTGALDNGSNATMLIDIARQITRLGLRPRRTIRLVLWNGEEQGLYGSWGYVQRHREALDDHVVAGSIDIGTGRITGFFTGGMPGLAPLVDAHLAPVRGLGPFEQIDIPLVGTDNFDFMMEGVPNLIANQADANYASNYHAESDTFDKVDQQQLKLNSAIAAAVIWGFANSADRVPRHTRAQVENLIETTDLEAQMRHFGVWAGWAEGRRGRKAD
jgi:carboxypeptidase Q